MEEVTYGTNNYTKVPRRADRRRVIEDFNPAPPPSPAEYDSQNPAFSQPPEEIPQSLRNHALPPSFGGNHDDILNKLRAQQIEGYTAPTRVKPSNNRGGTYSRYVDRPAESKTNPYVPTGSQHTHKTEFNKAYAVKPCVQCNFPLDQCQCAMAQNSRK